MKKYNYYILFTLFLFCAKSIVFAQQKSNLVTKKISTKKDTIFLDTLSIVPNTVMITTALEFFSIDHVNSTLIWKQKPSEDSVSISYRTFPYKLNRTVQALDYETVKNNYWVKPYRPKNVLAQNKLIDLGKIDYSGSFSRGLNFGNAQDAVLNSNLNMQLTGMLADSIEIAASISDQNLPIQPDGSTTQLNEIDRIYIELKKKNWTLSVGDIDLRQNQHYYLNFYKRLQGAAYETKVRVAKNATTNLLLSGAMARGKFTSNTFQGLEGNQGPYRLQGANNEFFFIVLGGTERVYMDGELLQRGEDQDYIINYNTAEITFTPKTLITKDKRIRVEFEYNDRNYVNTQLYAGSMTKIGKKLKVGLSYFSNSDSKNAPVNIELNTQQKLFLKNIGDTTSQAYYPSFEIDTLSAGKILYHKKDTISNSILYTIYKYSINPDSAKYRLSFSELGFGKGNYVIDFNGANGKVYKWVAPVGGVKQGNYEPVEFLVAPKKQQIMVLSTEYAFNNFNTVHIEIASSKNDINTFSNKDKGNDNGFAGKLKYANTYGLKKGKINTDIAIENNDKNFRTIERLRNPEFNRDWNLPFIVPFVDESLVQASTNYISEKGDNLKLQYSKYGRANGYNGNRVQSMANYTIKGWQFNGQISSTNTNDSLHTGTFLRPIVNMNKTFEKLNNHKLAFNYFLEKNALLNKVGDSLNPLSIAFDSYKLTFSSDESKKNRWGIGYTFRNNRIPIKKQLELSDKAQDYEAFVLLAKNPDRNFYFKATYRDLEVLQPTKVSYKSDKTLLGRTEYNFSEWKGFWQGNILYESGSGQEQRRDFAFLQVPTGQGEYYWRDYNNDGQQQLNEFEIATFRDQRQFIKIFVPTNQFVKANFNNFNYSTILNPKAILRKSKYKGMKDFISRTYLKSAFQIAKKEISNSVIDGNPFKTKTLDTTLISLSRAFTNTFSFNKFSTNWGIDFNQDYRIYKSLLTYGYETRELNTYSIKARWNINQSLLAESVAKQSKNQLITPAFNNRNYEIDNQSIEAKLSYIYKTKWRLESVVISEKKKNNPIYGGELANINSVIIEGKYNALQNAAINGKFTYTNIAFTGNQNSTIGFTMLDALLPGKNYLWNIDLIKTLRNNLEITFRYEGRQSAGGKTVHIGSATMRANFY